MTARKKPRCRATTVRLDAPVPSLCHCRLPRGHAPPHECEHGFEFGSEPPLTRRSRALPRPRSMIRA